MAPTSRHAAFLDRLRNHGVRRTDRRGCRGFAGSSGLSRDSLVIQQIAVSFRVQVRNRSADGQIEGLRIGEGLVCEMMSLEAMPDHLDVVALWRVLRQPFDSEPMAALGESSKCRLTGVDRAAVVEHDDNRLRKACWARTVEGVDLFEESDEIGAAFGRAGVHDQPARDINRGLPSWRFSWIAPVPAR
jgi:hypothetical protein